MSTAEAVDVNEHTASKETRQFHDDTFVFDGLAIAYVLEEKFTTRCLEGGVNGANVTFSLEEGWDATLRQVENYLSTIEKSPDLRLCLTSGDLLAAQAAGQLGVVFGTQGASMLEGKIDRLELLVRLGLRILGLAYTTANEFGDGCGEKRDAGLSYLGEELVEASNALPIMLDLSHCGHQTRADTAALGRAPVCTHSNADGLRSNGRNTTDDTIKAMVSKGGMIGVCGLPQSLADGTPTLDDLLDHVDHIAALVGSDHIGIGVDYVEKYAEQETVLAPPSVVMWRTRRPDIFGPLSSFGRQSYPQGIETVTKLPNLTQGLLDRGYDKDAAAAIMGGNWLRTFKTFCG